MDLLQLTFAVIVALIIGVVIGYIFKKKSDEKHIGNAKANAESIVDAAIAQAKTLKREALFEAKEENLKYRNELEQELKERRTEVTGMEKRLELSNINSSMPPLPRMRLATKTAPIGK